MQAADSRLSVQVGQGSGDPEYPMITARGKAHALGRVGQKPAAFGIGRRDFFQHGAVRLRVGSYRR